MPENKMFLLSLESHFIGKYITFSSNFIIHKSLIQFTLIRSSLLLILQLKKKLTANLLQFFSIILIRLYSK